MSSRVLGVPANLTSWIGAVLLVASSLPAFASPFTPREWQGETMVDGSRVTGKLVTWNRDQNRNFIDDLLDDRLTAAMEEAGVTDADVAVIEETADIIVDFNRCVTCCAPGEEEEVITFLRGLGSLDHVSTHVTFAVVLGVRLTDLESIAQRDEVAMVELLEPAQGMLNVSVRAIKVRASGTFSPNTVEDAFPAIDGSGVNIAIVDSGVDNAGGPGTTHAMFPPGTFVGGANCLTNPCTVTDPDDDQGHGSHVAGTALGRQTACGGASCRGVAPAAGLVDIKVLNSANFCVGSSCIRGVELAIDNRNLWGIDVVNLSIGNCSPSNGMNATAQLINTAVSQGLVVSVANGNSTNCGLPGGTALINDWSSASLAVSVQAVADGNTVAHGNDQLATFHLRGPRLSDGDNDPMDEQKPEISAPGVSVLSAARDTTNGFVNFSGTSMAAPHVSGAAALLLEASPTINPGSVKEVLVRTAVQSNKPGPHPGYETGWGFGFLDMFAALSRVSATDVGRPTEPPYAPCNAAWCSPHISTATPPKINVANTITAQVRNHTGVAATNARVCFGAYVFSNNFNRFFELGCAFASIPGNTTQPVSIPWTPSPALLPPGFPAGQNLHTCLKVSIDYAFDTVFANNEMQRNVTVAQASVARVNFRLENNLPEEAEVELIIENDSDWDVRIMENGEEVSPFFTLASVDCPRDLVIELEPPPDARQGETAQVIVRAIANGEIDFGGVVIDGVVSPKPTACGDGVCDPGAGEDSDTCVEDCTATETPTETETEEPATETLGQTTAEKEPATERAAGDGSTPTPHPTGEGS